HLRFGKGQGAGNADAATTCAEIEDAPRRRLQERLESVVDQLGDRRTRHQHTLIDVERHAAEPRLLQEIGKRLACCHALLEQLRHFAHCGGIQAQLRFSFGCRLSMAPQHRFQQPAGLVPGIVGAVAEEQAGSLQRLGASLYVLQGFHVTIHCLAQAAQFSYNTRLILRKSPLMTDTMTEAYATIIRAVGEDLERPGLVGTPERAAKAMQFLTRGYRQNIDEVINDAYFPTRSNEMVIVKNIELYSLCEHHLLPFIGKCHVAYLPKGQAVGLSKVARIVDMYARRLHIQERLTNQVATALQTAINPAGVAVVIEAKHLCMMMRGVEKQNSVMTTSSMLGLFRRQISTRSEFLNLINRK